ncbi:MAG TPA: glycosyltransferase [Polyangiales bacterium]
MQRPERAPRVSVIMPVYNRASVVEQALRSVLEQSFTDLELIVVDDGSTDETYERVLSVGDRRVTCHRQANSGRPSIPRNVAIRIARGDYVAFIDSDDVWLPGKLERQVELMDARPDAGLIYALAAIFDDHRELGYIGPRTGSVPERIFEALLLSGCFFQTTTVMLRREVIDRVGLFNEDVRYRVAEDYDLWIRVAYRYPTLFLPQVVARYRQHAASFSNDKREAVTRVRYVIEDNCALYAVDPELRNRALSHAYFEEFKVELQVGGSIDRLRACLLTAIELDDRNRSARYAQALLAAGLLAPLRVVYRGRHHLAPLRQLVNRIVW